MKGWKLGLVLVGLVGLAAAGAFWSFTSARGEKEVPQGVAYRSKSNAGAGAASWKTNRPNRKKSQIKRIALPVRREPPQFDIGAEEAKLTEAQARLLAEIRAALKAEKKKEIVRLIRRLQAMDEWPDGIPLPIKRASLEALGWCGASALPELLGFLGDSDQSIVAEASSYWEDAIAACDHDMDKQVDGELEEGLSTHVKNASKVIKDEEVMESVLSEITSGMRHSVAVETIKDILASGNEVAKAKVQDVIEELTDDETIKTAEQLDAWLKKNPDDSDDGFMYGGDESGNEE